MFINELKEFLNLINKSNFKKRVLPSILEDNEVNKIAIKIKT